MSKNRFYDILKKNKPAADDTASAQSEPTDLDKGSEPMSAESDQTAKAAEDKTGTAETAADTETMTLDETGKEPGQAAKDAEASSAEKAEQTVPPAAKDPKDEKIAELQKRLLRLQADFDNFRRRNTEERDELSTFVTIGIVGKFLKILDNFQRAIASAQKADDAQSVVTGMQNTERLFLQTMTELGVKEIPALHQKFDPHFHEAVMRGQNPELEDDVIDAVFEKGYELNKHVIRHSKVRVINND